MRKMTNYLSISVSEYETGENEARLVRLDGPTRHFLPEYISSVEQPARDPFSLEELLLMAALEVYARRVDPQMKLPW